MLRKNWKKENFGLFLYTTKLLIAITMEEVKHLEKDKANVEFKFRHILYLLVIILLVLSLISHTASDFDVLSGGSDEPIRNWIGPFGAQFSRAVLYLFGIAAYPLLFFLVICALRPVVCSVPVKREGYFGAILAVIFATCILFGMFPLKFASLCSHLGIGSHEDGALSSLSGGVIGQFLAAPVQSVSPGLLSGFLGEIGTFIIGFVFLTSGLIFIWFADWQPIFATRRSKSWKEDLNLIDEAEKDKTLESLERLRKSKLKEREEKEKPYLEAVTEKGTVNVLQEKQPTTEKEQVKPEKEVGIKEITKSSEKVEEKRLIQTDRKKVIKDVKRGQDIHYELPPLSLLERGSKIEGENPEIIEASKQVIQDTLRNFKVEGTVVAAVSGPRVTRYEIGLEPGVKVNKVTELTKNLAMALEAESIRMIAPIPGKNTIGVEIPNTTVSTITLRSILETEAWQRSKMKMEIPVILGRDVEGKAVITDLAKAPHMLIAGATGSGKSVCMHSIILSILYKFSPYELKFIMVDPKMVEFTWYKTLPHLMVEVVNAVKKVPRALRWGVNEMERRYKLFSELKARNLSAFNSRDRSKDPETDSEGNPIPYMLPYIVIIIDELADIMMTEYKQEVETSIARIAQKGRAAGIHMIIATQTPRTNIITGAIKANIPSRIALQVASGVDSRVILDCHGAEKLLGKGDMLFTPPGSSNQERIQGTYIQDHEIEKVVSFISDQAEPEFDESILKEDEEEAGKPTRVNPEIDDIIQKYLGDSNNELLKKALEVILLDKKASTSYLQRRLGIGYNKSAELIEELERRGIVGPPVGASAKREILVEGYEDIKRNDDEE